jgi:uncharacterized integral membrane protein
MRFRPRRPDEASQGAAEAAAEQESEAPAEEGLRAWQPRLYARLILLFAIIAFAIGFVLENRKQVHLHFVFGTARVSLIWLILLSIALGLLVGVLLSQLSRRRRRRH